MVYAKNQAKNTSIDPFLARDRTMMVNSTIEAVLPGDKMRA
eukprot:CAMPEP_0172359402 /NCGR_PEP_ID=MMETSP1060-20121228/3615_1 /TAXON_ID=37318 /ORGANISM="Pseudo-nitzschia pungens, Strain cf. cingulata" /LENGTH=40 /DNA_ID= /DNA_START= /DNA_END= /DNA_ORIENTATION=